MVAGGFLGYLGDSMAQAIVIGERLVADQERVLGPDHPDTLGSRHALAGVYRAAGRTEEAISLHEQVLPAYERVLGLDPPETLLLRENLALVYQDAGRTGEAISLHEQVLAAREHVLGPDHPTTLRSRSHLAAPTRMRAAPVNRETDPQPSDP